VSIPAHLSRCPGCELQLPPLDAPTPRRRRRLARLLGALRPAAGRRVRPSAISASPSADGRQLPRAAPERSTGSLRSLPRRPPDLAVPAARARSERAADPRATRQVARMPALVAASSRHRRGAGRSPSRTPPLRRVRTNTPDSSNSGQRASGTPGGPTTAPCKAGSTESIEETTEFTPRAERVAADAVCEQRESRLLVRALTNLGVLRFTDAVRAQR
jgi:hypothetical protein